MSIKSSFHQRSRNTTRLCTPCSVPSSTKVACRSVPRADVDTGWSEGNRSLTPMRTPSQTSTHHPSSTTTVFSSQIKSTIGNILVKWSEKIPIAPFYHWIPETRNLRRLLVSGIHSLIIKSPSLCIKLNIDGVPITSKSHTHPSHSETSRLLTSSLSLGVTVRRTTQCMWDV